MKKIVLPSGATLELTQLPFETAFNLFQDVASVLKSLNIDLNILKMDINNPIDILRLSAPMLSIFSNKEIVSLAKSTFAKTLYNGFRINDETFEKDEARKDYIAVLFCHIYENVSPFLSGLVSYLEKSLK